MIRKWERKRENNNRYVEIFFGVRRVGEITVRDKARDDFFVEA